VRVVFWEAELSGEIDRDETLAEDTGEEVVVVGIASRESGLEILILGVVPPDAALAYDLARMDCPTTDLSIVSFRVCISSLTWSFRVYSSSLT
jgi:hypothetical protein